MTPDRAGRPVFDRPDDGGHRRAVQRAGAAVVWCPECDAPADGPCLEEGHHPYNAKVVPDAE